MIPIEMFKPLSEEDVAAHAQNCGGCNEECRDGCTLGIDIKKVMSFCKKKQFAEAHQVIRESNPLPRVTGRLCSAPCEAKCPKGIPVKSIERFLADVPLPKAAQKKLKKTVAVVGSGLAGLTCASKLAEEGYQVSLLEAAPQAGGFLARHVPKFRFSQETLDKTFSELDVPVQTNALVGNQHPVEALAEQFNAVIIATGANKPLFNNIPGENLHNVLTASEFMTFDKDKPAGTTFVMGGNNAALDCAIHAVTTGDQVTVIFEKDITGLDVNKDLLEHAQEKGVRFMLLTAPVAYLGETKVTSVRFVPMALAEGYLDQAAVPMEDAEFELLCDRVILAHGFEPNPTIAASSTLRLAGKNKLWVNEHFQTTIPNVFAVGGIIKGYQHAEKIIQHAKVAAENVAMFLKGK